MSEREPIKAEEAQEAPEWLLKKPHLCDDGTYRAYSIGSPHREDFGEFKAPDEGWFKDAGFEYMTRTFLEKIAGIHTEDEGFRKIVEVMADYIGERDKYVTWE